MAPLDGAVTLTQPDAVAVLVGQNLHLDVPRSVDGPLEVHGRVAEGRASFAHRLAEGSLEARPVGDHAQALATASSDSLQRDRIRTALDRKCPKLLQASEGGRVSVLILESDDIALASRRTVASATALGSRGRVRMLEPPHTQDNYLLQEMGFRIARKHKTRLRLIARLAGFILPALLSLTALVTSGMIAAIAAAIAVLSAALGLVVERWLFFAEAKHTVMLYYGADAV